jgi:hypothetical protein
MKQSSYKKAIPYAAAIAVFLILTIGYLFPLFEGKAIISTDITNFGGMAQELIQYRNQTGEEALWTNSMFSGMPGYLISTKYPLNLVQYVDKVLQLGLPYPMGLVFLYFLGFFILLLSCKVDKWISLAGAIGFALSSYFLILLEAGHNSKAHAIAYMAPVLAGVILAYRGKYLLGGIIAALFLALQINAYHLQITYYLMIIILLFAVAEVFKTIREKSYSHFIKASSVLILAALLALATNTSRLWTTLEQSKYSIRSRSELTINQENQTSGLDKDYATAWSYGIPETMTLLIPNFHGGSSAGELGENSETYRILSENSVPNARQIVKQLPLYWGTQPFTSGPVYAGAIVCFLFILGLFVVKGPVKWWLLAATLLSILLAWGKNFMPLTEFFLNHVPAYNKFRAVSMTLVIAELTIPLLGFYTLHKVMNEKNDVPSLKKALKFVYLALGIITLVFVLFPGSFFSFSSPSDGQYQFPDWLLGALQDDRLRMLRMDSLRSFIFISLGFGLLWLFISGKMKKQYVILAFGVLIVVDMWPVDKRYLNGDDFDRKSQLEKPFKATVADQLILEDKTPYYRVWNMTEDFDKSARTSYFHKNIGGYHAAKLRRYQELYDYQLSEEWKGFAQLLSSRPDMLAFNLGLRQMKTFNMLNTRYIIFDPQKEPILNLNAMGNAWFVPQYKLVPNADMEMAEMNTFDPRNTAIINESFQKYVNGYTPYYDSTATIALTNYQPNRLEYQSSSSHDQLAVFSEVYYPQGWNAYLDGQKADFFRTNYVLRGMLVPQGNHTIEFRFEPRSYHFGETVSLISSLVLILVLVAAVYVEWRNSRPSATSGM